MTFLEHLVGVGVYCVRMSMIIWSVTSFVVRASEDRIRKEIAELRKPKDEE